jgi:predicted RNA-binding protein with RPS1 domain
MELTKRKIHYCKVMQIKQTYILLQFHNTTGICHISETSDYLVSDMSNYFKVGQSYYFLLLDSTSSDGKFRFSYKKIRPKLLKWHYAIIPTLTNFDNLYQHTLNLIR